MALWLYVLRITFYESPLDQLPDPRLDVAGLEADLGEDRDGAFEVCHRRVRLSGGVEQVGQVVVQRRLAVPIALRDAQRQRGLGQLQSARNIVAGATCQRQVVERRDANAGIFELLR